jgi:hypothetical protein
VSRHDESVTRRGTSLWESVLEFIEQRRVISREAVLEQFARDDEGLVRSVLHDLTDSGLVFRSGVRTTTMYRIASPNEMGRTRSRGAPDSTDALVWVLIRREGPLSRDALATRTDLPPRELEAALGRLLSDGRIREATMESSMGYYADSIVIPVGATSGSEAAIYDHFQAVVKTILCKLRKDESTRARDERLGGSTYGFDVWSGHPFAEEVYGQLRRFREATSELRSRVDAFNSKNSAPSSIDRVTVYMGQCVISEEESE